MIKKQIFFYLSFGPGKLSCRHHRLYLLQVDMMMDLLATTMSLLHMLNTTTTTPSTATPTTPTHVKNNEGKTAFDIAMEREKFNDVASFIYEKWNKKKQKIDKFHRRQKLSKHIVS